MPAELRDSVVVITGASSGIGRATAQAFAKEGATLLLAARGEEALDQAKEECTRAGGHAVSVPTDVTDARAVGQLAQLAVERFGHLDVWVNNAAVTLFGRFEDAPLDMVRKVIDTDLFGYIHGARAALPVFRKQGHGTLINVSSVAGKVPQPYASAYVIAKHGIRALGQCLWQELLLDGAKDIHVCTVMPGTVDTPLFQHAANYLGRAPRAMPPVLAPEDVADVIVKLAKHPQREVYVGKAARVISLQHAVAPETAEKIIAKHVDKDFFGAAQGTQASQGNLVTPNAALDTTHGGWSAANPPAHPVRNLLLGTLALALAVVPVALGFMAIRRQRAGRFTRLSRAVFPGLRAASTLVKRMPIPTDAVRQTLKGVAGSTAVKALPQVVHRVAEATGLPA